MKRRKVKMSGGHKRHLTNTAKSVHKKNLTKSLKRGGYRF